MSTSRLEAFSDGVFAVAITLLALDLVNLAFLSAGASLALCGLVAVYYMLPERLPEHPGAQPPPA